MMCNKIGDGYNAELIKWCTSQNDSVLRSYYKSATLKYSLPFLLIIKLRRKSRKHYKTKLNNRNCSRSVGGVSLLATRDSNLGCNFFFGRESKQERVQNNRHLFPSFLISHPDPVTVRYKHQVMKRRERKNVRLRATTLLSKVHIYSVWWHNTWHSNSVL